MSHTEETAVPVAAGEEVVVEVEGLGHEGEGVGRAGGFALFVPGALPGEKVRAKVRELKKRYGCADLLEVLEPSPERIQPPCPVFGRCGGCQLQHMEYDAQLRWKRKMVTDALERIGKLDLGRVTVHPTLGMAEPRHYRNKAQVPAGTRGGRLVAGFYAMNSRRIVETDACLIQHEMNNRVVEAVRRIAAELGITGYNEETRSGHLRHIVVRTGFATGEVMVVLVTNGERLPRAAELCERIAAAVPGVKSICQNVNTSRTPVVMGDRTKALWGRDVIYDRIGDVEFAISAESFYQVNPAQTEVLYRKALDYAGLTGAETVIDAYCGIGTISLFLARKAKRVYGVEIVPEAIEDAKRNAELNGIRNVEFAVGRAEDVLPRWHEAGVDADVIVVDPPRKGCERSLLETIIAMKPKRVVYVSCNPSTLARDLRILEDGGFRTVEVQPVDMFPHSGHVETVVLMSRL